MENVEYPVAVFILISYFIFILGLLCRIKGQLLQTKTRSTSFGHVVFILLTILSFIATWTYMFKFFFHSYRQWHKGFSAERGYSMELSLNSVSYWLHDVSLFDSAWRQVSVGQWQWLWSHQLCSLTVSVWTPILAIEGTRRNIPYIWAYMLLGQVVAISVASSLFFYVMISFPVIACRQPSKALLSTLVISTVGGIITVVISPFVASSDGFMPNLLVMHALLVIPLIHTSCTTGACTSTKSNAKDAAKVSVTVMGLYILAAGANFSIYANQWMECIATLNNEDQPIMAMVGTIFHKLIVTFLNHPAQSSISYDIVCMQLISIAWMLVHSYNDNYNVSQCKLSVPTLLLMLLTPVLSASVTLPLFMAYTEYRKLLTDIADDKKKEL